jgi:hypothetical protein
LHLTAIGINYQVPDLPRVGRFELQFATRLGVDDGGGGQSALLDPQVIPVGFKLS